MSDQTAVEIPARDGDGYLVEMDHWTPDIARAMAREDGIDLNDTMWGQIDKARLFYDENGVVPPIRKFSKYLGIDKKELFTLWQNGPMKPITKYGGLPKPRGCV